MSSNPEIIIREALLAAKDAWFSGRVFDDGLIHVQMSIDEFNERIGVAAPALNALVRERDEARAENERLRLALSPYMEVACSLASVLGLCDDNALPAVALARLQQHLTCRCPAGSYNLTHLSWCPAALAAAQEPPAYTPAPECPRCGLFLAPGEVHGEHEVGCVARGPAPRDEIRHLRERLDAQTNVLGWIRDTFPDATDCWGEDVRLDSSECEPPAEGGDR